MFTQIWRCFSRCWCLLFPCCTLHLSCLWICIKLLSWPPWRLRWHFDANLLVSWNRVTTAWREIHFLTPAYHEIIELCSGLDCMLSGYNPNLFHSLRGWDLRGCRKQTDWADLGGLMSIFHLSCWCHMKFRRRCFFLVTLFLDDTVIAKHHSVTVVT